MGGGRQHPVPLAKREQTSYLYGDCESQPGADGPGRLTRLHIQLTRGRHHHTIQPTCTETVSPSLKQMARAASPVCTASSREGDTTTPYQPTCTETVSPSLEQMAQAASPVCTASSRDGDTTTPYQPTCTETVSPSLEQMARATSPVYTASSREGDTTKQPTCTETVSPSLEQMARGRLTGLHNQLPRGRHHHTIQPTVTKTVSPSLEQMAQAASPVCTASSREGDTTTPFNPPVWSL
jgi:hypothetical protein